MDFKEAMNDAVTYFRKRAGQCATNATLEDIDNAVSLAQGRIEQALRFGTFCQGDSKLIKRLSDANDGLGTISDVISKGRNTCIFINEAQKIADAVKVLNDPNVIQHRPLEAAKAFDTLFQGIGMICKRLPSPAREWAMFFENFNLFSGLAPLLDPETNPYHKENWAGARDSR